ncbi:uncharacterized lipoprotein [Desulfovibrionales bacterium]
MNRLSTSSRSLTPALILFLLSTIFLIAGCTRFMGQAVFIEPTIHIDSYGIGQGKTIAINVIDVRSDQVIGYRDTNCSKTAPIIISGNIAESVQRTLVSAMSQQGFCPTSNGYGPRILTVEIRLLSYRAKDEHMSKRAMVKAILTARATNNSSFFNRDYQVEKEQEKIIALNEDDNNRLINDALSQPLTALATDQSLLDFLAQGSW